MRSIKLLTVRGIEIKMHITFPLILIWAAIQFGFLNQSGFSVSGAAFGVVVTLLLFVCVVIHELSHSLTAIRMGYPVKDIVLMPLGGVSEMEQMPERPWEEFLMAVAGPASNVVIAGLLILLTLPLPVSLSDGLRKLALNPAGLGWSDLLPYLILTNIGLAVFNLIPAFPMDGGRVLRALLATVMPQAQATAVAVSVGQGLAWVLGLLGLLTGNLIWILIAVFVYAGAAQEGRMTKIKNVLAGFRVRQAFSRHAEAVSPDDPVSHVADLTLESFQADFPVCDGEQVVGMLTYTDVLGTLKQRRPETPVREVMRTDFPTVGLNDELLNAQQLMQETNLDALPVIDKGSFLGLLTNRDLNEFYQLLSASPELVPQETKA
jgi:stage IV sporulation protein FB